MTNFAQGLDEHQATKVKEFAGRVLSSFSSIITFLRLHTGVLFQVKVLLGTDWHRNYDVFKKPDYFVKVLACCSPGCTPCCLQRLLRLVINIFLVLNVLG